MHITLFKEIGWSLLLFVTISLSSCMYNSEDALYGIDTCSETLPSYQQSIEPLILQNCASVEGCHNAGGHHPLLTNYEEISAKSKVILKRIQNGTMPKAGSGLSLTEEEKTIIFCWVNAGSPNN